MKKINYLIPLFKPHYGRDEIGKVNKVLKSGWIGLGPETEEFERKFAKYVGSKYAVALNSATSALHLALIVSDVKKGDEVIVPALTFVSTAHVAEYLKAKPVFADLQKDTLCLNPSEVEKNITNKTKAIVVVHYGGHPGNMDELLKIAKRYNITLIEDAAHACGSKYYDKMIGNVGPLTCFSFHAVKNLATGDGGMITTNDKKVADKLKSLRWMGINKSTWGRIENVTRKGAPKKSYGWYYEVDALGYKYHMNDIAAALGLAQLEKLDRVNEKRRRLAGVYTKALDSIPEIECPTTLDGVISSQHNYAIRLDNRDKLYLYLKHNNISTGVHYLPLHMQPYYSKRHKNTQLPVTESEWKRILLLPLFPSLTKKEQEYIISKVAEFFDNKKMTVKTTITQGSRISQGSVKLRPLEKDDIEILRIWRNASRKSFLSSHAISQSKQKKWFLNYQNNERDIVFVIENNLGESVGAVSLYDFEPDISQVEYGRLIIDPKRRGKGHAHAATKCLVNYAFKSLGYRTIYLEVLKSNKIALELYKKIGFEQGSPITVKGKIVIPMKLYRTKFIASKQ
ncbi:GNAT family N-acetyltransferase [Patescibacteria group bacterium]